MSDEWLDLFSGRKLPHVASLILQHLDPPSLDSLSQVDPAVFCGDAALRKVRNHLRTSLKSEEGITARLTVPLTEEQACIDRVRLKLYF